MKVQEFFHRTPVFTHREFVAFLDPCGYRSSRTPESILAYYSRKGRILRVRRGLYVAVPFGVDPESCPIDPFLLAAKMADDAVLAYHTALQFHGKAHSMHERFLYVTGRPTRPVNFRTYRFRGVLFPKKLRNKGQEGFGVTKAERSGVDVRVTTLERTLVDVLDRPHLGGTWEEIWRSLEAVEFFDLNGVSEYALLLGNATTIAKVGFFLDQHREVLMVDDTCLRRLHERRPRTAHYMVRKDRRRGHVVTEWNLVVPPEVFRRSWAEVP
jgi:predicted transcriptional regulator of viral defense system